MSEGDLLENLGLDNMFKNATGKTSEEILALKEEIATHYVSDLIEKKGSGISGMLIGQGEDIKKYIIGNTTLFSQWSDFKGNIMNNLFTAVDQKSFEIDGVKYTGISDYIEKKKTELAGATTEEDLKTLKGNVFSGIASTPQSDEVSEQERDENDEEYEVGGTISKWNTINEYLSALTGGIINKTKAKSIIENQLVEKEFMGTSLKINTYMADVLEEVEKDIKASDDESLKKYTFVNMSTYNWRNVRGGNSLSYHALGLAIDIDPANNPMVSSKRPNIKTNMPDALIKIFNDHGFIWGGNRGNTDRKKGSTFRSDAMHFEFRDKDLLTAAINKAAGAEKTTVENI